VTSAPPPALDALAGVVVVVADDALESRDLIKRVLEAAGARVQAVGSAREALAAIERARPHALVTDINMPGDSGYTLMRWVRALDPDAGGRIPAVALTGHTTDEDRLTALSVGFEEHLSKPASPAELVKVVARMVGRANEQAVG
jgi:CheY-like chemotaxis protein